MLAAIGSMNAAVNGIGKQCHIRFDTFQHR